jgi:hypothetical protein
MNQIGGRVAVLLAEAARVSAVPIEDAVKLAQAAAARQDSSAVLIDPIEIIVDRFELIRIALDCGWRASAIRRHTPHRGLSAGFCLTPRQQEYRQ